VSLSRQPICSIHYEIYGWFGTILKTMLKGLDGLTYGIQWEDLYYWRLAKWELQLSKKTKSFATNDWWLIWSSPFCNPIIGCRWQEHIAQTIVKNLGHTKSLNMSIKSNCWMKMIRTYFLDYSEKTKAYKNT